MIPHLAAAQVWPSVESGETVLVDLRSPSDFAAGFPRGALSLEFSARGLAERLATILRERPSLVLVAEPVQQAATTEQLRSAGWVVLGAIEGLEEWSAAGLPVDRLDLVGVGPELAHPDGGDFTLVDVREPIEWDTGHVPGARLLALGSLVDKLDSLPADGHVVVICEAGVRSSSAASVLKRHGFGQVGNILAGTGGYRRAGLPLAFPEGRP